MAVQRQNIDVDVDERVGFTGAVVGPPRTVGELRIILEDFEKNEPNEWFSIEEAQKAVRNLYFVLFDQERRPDFDDWDKITKELGEELDRRAKEGENWETRPLSEIDSEVAKAWEEAINEPDLSAKVDTAILRELLEKMDDANARRDIDAEAKRLESIYGKYLKRQTIEEILKAKIAYHEREAEEIKRLRPEASAEKIRELADKRTDARIVAEEKLLHEANRPPEEAKILAQEIARAVVEPEVRRVEVMAMFDNQPEKVRVVVEDVAVSEEIREKLGERATPEMLGLARETERNLRNALGETAVEVTVAVINGAKAEEAIPKDIKIEAKDLKRVERELKITEATVAIERRIEEKRDEVTDRLIEVLGVRDEEAIREIKQEVGERIRTTLKDGGELNRPVVVPVEGIVVAPMRMTDRVEKITGTEVPENKIKEASAVLRQADKELERYRNGQTTHLLEWGERLVKRDVFAITGSPVMAERVGEIYGPRSGILVEEHKVWQEANLAGEISPIQKHYLETFTNMIRSPVSIMTRLEETKDLVGVAVETSPEAQAYSGIMAQMRANPDLAMMMERARRVHRMVGGVQDFIVNRMGSIKGLEGFANSLANSIAPKGVEFAKGALAALKNSEGLAAGMKAMLGLVGGSGAGGAVASGAAALGLSVTGVGAVVVVVAALGKLAGWLGGKIQGFFSKLGIDIPNIGGLIGGISGFLGLKGGLGGLVKGVPGLVTKAGALGANFAAGLMGAVSTAMAGLSISSVAIWGPIVGVLVFVLIIIGPLISAMVPPGRGVGGAVVDQTTLNGGYLAAPAWSGDINELPDSCPPDSLPIGGTVTQGPDAIGCSHSGYKNVIDVAGPEVDVVATHDGVVETVVNMGSDYGQFVDVRAKCNGVVFVTRYAHLVVGLPQITTGQKITAGTTIGKSDNSGNSIGTHLHYEIRGLTTNYFSNWKGCCITNGITCQN